MPLYSAHSANVRKDLRAWVRGTTIKRLKTTLPRKPLKRGGEVYNVPNVSVEPELANKILLLLMKK